MAVLVLDKRKCPLMPCTEKRARLLLDRGRAVVVRIHPFTIRLKDRIGGATQPVRLKIDPGSQTTGMALVRVDSDGTKHVLLLAELRHRSYLISKQLTQRRYRRKRRRSKLRHRPARFKNRSRPQGWLSPSQQHPVDNVMTWVERFRRWAPITDIIREVARFDRHCRETLGIDDIRQQNAPQLRTTSVRERLLHLHDGTCAYCEGLSGETRLEVEHVQPRSRGGSQRLANLVISCRRCNEDKGGRNAAEWAEALARSRSRLGQTRHRNAMLVNAGQRPSGRDPAAVHRTSSALSGYLKATGLPLSSGRGWLTQENRRRLGIPKTHALDAACVGLVDSLVGWRRPTLGITAAGRGSYRRTNVDRHGFPRSYRPRRKMSHGYQTGDHVRATVPTGKKAGTHVGRVAIRAGRQVDIVTATGRVQSISYRHCRLIQRADGYGYATLPSPRMEEAGLAKCNEPALLTTLFVRPK